MTRWDAGMTARASAPGGIGSPPGGPEALQAGCLSGTCAAPASRVAIRGPFSTLRIFRPCGDPRIGIEPPQNGPHQPRKGPALTSAVLVPTERKPNVDENSFPDGCGRVRVEPGRGFVGFLAAIEPIRGPGLMMLRSIADGVEVLAP